MSEEIRTYRGSGLEELLPRIRAELGEDAVIVARREDLSGGVGGFFAKRQIEVDARRAGSRLDVRDEDAAEPEPSAVPEPDAPFAEHLARLGAEPQPPAGAHRPVVDPRVAEAPFTVDDIFAPGPQNDLARLFAAGQNAVVPEPPVQGPAPEPAPLPAPVPAAAPVAAAPAVRVEGAAPAELPAEARPLVEHGLSEPFVRAVTDEAVTHLMPFARDADLGTVLRGALASRIPIARPKVGPTGGVIGFVGPGGAGKTRCVARLATAYAARSPLPVACVTLRPKDGGAELSRLLASTGVPVHAEESAEAAAARVGELRSHALVLLDTPGVSPRAEAELRTLSAELRRLAADELHLAVPATIGAAAARELVAGTRGLGVDAIALTHGDETEHLGVVVELAAAAGLPLSFVARGTALESGLRPAVADELALALLPPSSAVGGGLV